MSSIQRTLLALLGLLAAAGVGYLIVETGGGAADGGAGGLELGRSATREPPTTTEGAPASLAAVGGRHSVLAGSGTIVDVRTLNGLGRRVPRAAVRLSNADGEEWTGADAVRFEDLSPGAWTLEVTAKGMLAHTQAIEVIEGETKNYTVKLRKHLPITGTVRNRFGEPPGNTIIWFLRPGESHPMERQGARKLLEGQVGASGDFAIDLPKAGEYRVSVGPIGKPLATMSKPRELHPGGTQEVDIIVSGGTRLEIELENPPATLAAGKANLKVAIVGRAFEARGSGAKRPFKPATTGSRQAGSRRGKRSADAGGETADGDGRRRERETTKAEGPGPSGGKQLNAVQDQDPEASGAPEEPAQGEQSPRVGREEDAWIDRVTRGVPNDGRLFIDGLPAGEELKLAFMRRNDRHESINTFILPEDRHVVVRFAVPDRIPKEQAGEVQALSVRLDTLPPPADAPEVGFHWK